MAQYDVIIVGGGPGGLFAALEMAASSLSILLLERGRDIEKRRCPVQEGKVKVCPPCIPCHVVSGLGGAGAFSDGKLTLSPTVGGRLAEYVGQETAESLIHYVDEVYLGLGASDRLYGVGPEVEELRRRAALADLRLIPIPVRHVGTERLRSVLQGLRSHLTPRADMRLGVAATSIIVKDGQVLGVDTDRGERHTCTYLVVAPGREGAEWLMKEASRLGLTRYHNPVDLGVRVEVPAAVLEEFTRVLYEAKMEYFSHTFDDRIRTFCMCPYGEVTMETTGGADPVTTVNGHSYATHHTPNTNFALLVSTVFTQPFRDPIAYGKSVARLANLLSGGVLVQRLGDLQEGRRTTPARLKRGLVEPTLAGATPGDVSCAIPYRFLKGIMEMLEAMDRLAPGVASRHTLLYGVEVKFYSSYLHLSRCLETQVSNLFTVGDGAGVTRGLVQASASGVAAAREILSRAGVTATPATSGIALP